MRQPPPGLRPSSRSTTGGGSKPSPVTVPPPPPMDFTPAPDLVSDATPAPSNDLIATAPLRPLASASTPPPQAPVPTAPRVPTPARAAPFPTPPPAGPFPTPPPAGPFPTPPPAGPFPTPPPAGSYQTPPPAPPAPWAATPPPAAWVATPPPGPMQTPLPAPPEACEAAASYDIPDLTDEVDPQPAPAVWKEAHSSARKWAEKRQGGRAVSSSRRAPSLPRIVLGLLIAALGAWLVLSFLPDRKPLNAAERAKVEKQAGIDSDAWRFDQTGYMAARGGAALYLTIGVLVALRGLFYRRRVEKSCRRCGRVVLAERSGLWLRCDSGSHAAGVNASALSLLIAFVILSLAVVALIAMASLRL